MIMKGRTSLRLPWVGLCCLALVAAATLPAWASAQQPPPPPPPVPVVTVSKQVPPPAVKVQKAAPAPKVVVPKDDVKVHYELVQKMPPPPAAVKAAPMVRYYAWNLRKDALPAEGQQLLETFEADQKAIQEEADQKMEARRASAVKALEALQEQYTKAGKLDEAVAIRDYLRAGGPGSKLPLARYVIKR